MTFEQGFYTSVYRVTYAMSPIKKPVLYDFDCERYSRVSEFQPGQKKPQQEQPYNDSLSHKLESE